MAETVELGREYTFEAAHRLPRVPEGHPCARMHGHSYRVAVTLVGPVDEESGWLFDLFAVDVVVKPLIERLDHYCLNDVDGLSNPTCEALAIWLARRIKPNLPQLSSVTVWETATARCTYRV